MCPNCRAFITVNDRVCPYCGMQLGPRAVDLRATQLTASFLPSANTASVALLAINAFFFLLELLVTAHLGGGLSVMNIPVPVIVIMGCKYRLVFAGQWWRLITAGFLHGGLIHILMNSYALWILVTEAEQFYGTARFVVAYVTSTFTGFLLSALMSPGVPSVGASAGAFGLIGMMLAMTLRRRSDPMVQMIRSQYMQWLIFSLVLSFSGQIDIWAHVGGLAGGFVLGLIAGLPSLPNTPRETLWKSLAGASVLLVVFCFFQDFLSYRQFLQQLR